MRLEAEAELFKMNGYKKWSVPLVWKLSYAKHCSWLFFIHSPQTLTGVCDIKTNYLMYCIISTHISLPLKLSCITVLRHSLAWDAELCKTAPGNDLWNAWTFVGHVMKALPGYLWIYCGLYPGLYTYKYMGKVSLLKQTMMWAWEDWNRTHKSTQPSIKSAGVYL